MESNAATRHRRDIHRILTAALHAADAGRAVERVFRREGDALFVDGERLPLEPGSRLLVAGAGKVAAVMARAVAAVAGPLLTEGVVVSGAIGAMEEIHGVRVMVASHPYPDQGSLAAAAAILELVRDAGSDDVVLFLLAGGASAMLEQPVAGISLADLQAVTRLLLNAGASIVELNEVRKALSVVKAGGIVRAAAPAFTQTLAVSDVVGNSSAVIGSAPTVPGVSDAARAVNVLERYGLPPRLDGVVEVLRRAGAYAADVNETSTGYHVIASVDDALAGAERGEPARTPQRLTKLPRVITSSPALTTPSPGRHAARGRRATTPRSFAVLWSARRAR